MSFRTRLLGALLLAGLLPVTVIGLGTRKVMTDRVSAQYRSRVAALVSVIESDLEGQRTAIAARLDALESALADDNRFRLAAVQGVDRERQYLLDYAGGAMRLAGLAVLQIQDEAGRILSSGHFRNEYGRLEPGLPELIARATGGMAVITARTPGGPFLALARSGRVRLAGRSFTLVGGLQLERSFLAGLARDDDLAVSLVYPGGVLSSQPAYDEATLADGPPDNTVAAAELILPFVTSASDVQPRADSARLIVTYSLDQLQALRTSVNLWIAVAVAVTGLAALVLAGWLSARLSRPLTDLARKTSQIDLDRLDVTFASDRTDEIGELSRLLGAMTGRLQASAGRLLAAERRATVGDLARQLNHDIKNGLVPIRNVFRHLGQVVRDTPSELPVVFRDRQGTVDSSISYLETLASNYARLSPTLDRQPCDVNAAVEQVARHARALGRADLRLQLQSDLPQVLADAVVLRRIVENLVGNAMDSVAQTGGSVTVSTSTTGDHERSAVRITVSDTGPGMTEEQLERAFDDFFTTKTEGTGLGLSIVRRLVLDLNGTLRVESEPGVGSRFVVELPAESRTGG